MSESSKKTSRKKKRKKMSTKKKVLITLSTIILLICGLVAGGFAYTFNLLDKLDTVEIDHDNLGINQETEEKLSAYDNTIQNIALFGVDATDGNTGRSDSIMILTIDKTRNKLKVSSIMRDSYVSVLEKGKNRMDKINHAYAYGGPELAMNTINKAFDLNLKDFVSVDFSTLPKIIDTLGGLDLTISKEEAEYMIFYIDELNRLNGTNVPYITTYGTQHVNGTQALAYSRVRYTSGGDYERTQRHRTVLTALFEKFKETSPMTYPSLLNQLLPMVKTSLSSSEILDLATAVLSMGTNTVLEQDRFPRDEYSEGKMIDGVYYLTFDEETTSKQIHDYIFEDIK